MLRIGKISRSAKMKLITPPKLIPPFHSTAASGTFPTEHTNDAIETRGPTTGPQGAAPWHGRQAGELRRGDLPAGGDRHDDAELDDVVRRRERESHRRGEGRAFLDERASERVGRVGAGRGCGAEAAGDRDAARRVV